MEKSYLKTESYLSEIKEAIYSKNREQTDLLIKKLRHQMSDSDSQELKTNYISLWKNWAALKAEHELEDYKEYLPDNTDLFSLKSVEDAILKLAGAYESEEDEYALAYKPYYRELKRHYGNEAEDSLIGVLNILFEHRKNLINFEHHPLLSKLKLELVDRLNSLLIAKQKDLYNRAICVLSAIKPYTRGKIFNLKATIDFSEKLPEEFPDQSSRMKKLWKYMCSSELNNRGEFSIAELSIYEPDEIPSLNHFLYLCDYEDDWSHLLSGECGCYYLLPEIQTLRNIGYCMHNLTDHLNYSIHEVIYATDFKCSLNFEVDEMKL